MISRRLLALALLAAACRRAAPPPPPAARTLTDAMGRTVRLPPVEGVRRIVSLAPSATEIVCALGAGDRLVGIDRYSDYPPQIAGLPKIGADTDPSLERVVALRPDVVLAAASANTRATVEQLDRLGVPIYVSRAGSLDDVYRDLASVGELIGRAAEGKRLADALRARVGAVAARRQSGPRVRSLIVVWSEPLTVAGHGSHVADLLRVAGGENLADDSRQEYPTYSTERMLARAPEVLIVGTHSQGSPPLAPLERLRDRLGDRAFRIAEIDGDLIFRPGPRIADGVEALDRILHPVAK